MQFPIQHTAVSQTLLAAAPQNRRGGRHAHFHHTPAKPWEESRPHPRVRRRVFACSSDQRSAAGGLLLSSSSVKCSDSKNLGPCRAAAELRRIHPSFQSAVSRDFGEPNNTPCLLLPRDKDYTLRIGVGPFRNDAQLLLISLPPLPRLSLRLDQAPEGRQCGTNCRSSPTTWTTAQPTQFRLTSSPKT